MTVPINIPIITTSPPAAPPAKPAIKPERSESFEQILKQKTGEPTQIESVAVKPDQVVKDQPNNNIQMEEKPLKEEVKPDDQMETRPAINEVDDQRQTETLSQSTPVEVLAQAVPVAVVVIQPVVVADAPAQPSETPDDSGKSAVEAAPVTKSGIANVDNSVSAVPSTQPRPDIKAAQEVQSRSGKDFAAKPEAVQGTLPDADVRSFPSVSVTDPKTSQADLKNNQVQGFDPGLAMLLHYLNRSWKRSKRLQGRPLRVYR